jgi:hypothetical protein
MPYQDTDPYDEEDAPDAPEGDAVDEDDLEGLPAAPRRADRLRARGARPAAPAAPTARARPPRTSVQVAANRRGAAPDRRRPLVIFGVALLALILAGSAFAAMNRPAAPSAAPVASAPVPGAAASVNGKVIPMTAYEERLLAAKQDYIDQFGLNFDAPTTGIRMADVLGFDVLDQMINFEVIMQQAQKEGVVPNPTQVAQRYEQAQQAASQQHQTWDAFLKTQGVHSDAEFRQTIVDGFTYLIMAGNHTTQNGTDEQKAAALADYICSTRKNYDVKVYVQFIVPQAPCSSAAQVPGGPAPNITVPAGATPAQPVETGEPSPLTPSK